MNWVFLVVMLSMIILAMFLSIIFLIASICEYKDIKNATAPLKPPKEVLHEDAEYEQIKKQ